MMLLNRYKIKPILPEVNPDSKGLYAIKIAVYDSLKKKRFYKNTEHRILPKEWDKKNGYVRKNNAGFRTINHKVDGIIADLKKEIDDRVEKNKPVNLRALLDGKKAGNDLIEYFDKLIIELRNKYSEDTLRNYKNELRRLKEFSSAIYFDDVDPAWLRKYENFLHESGHLVKPKKTEAKMLSKNSIHKSWKILKKVFNSAMHDGLTNNYPFRNYDNPKYRQTDRTWLTLAEVDQIEDALKKPMPDYLRVAGTYFLLGCYSGLRFSDWQRFNPAFIQGDRLIVRAKKNGELVSLQMHPRLKKIVEELLVLGPVASEQKTNEYLKSVRKIAELQKKISTHVGRHSFAVRCAELGISIETTAELMGITIKTCLIYYKITNRKIDAEFEKWNSI